MDKSYCRRRKLPDWKIKTADKIWGVFHASPCAILILHRYQRAMKGGRIFNNLLLIVYLSYLNDFNNFPFARHYHKNIRQKAFRLLLTIIEFFGEPGQATVAPFPHHPTIERRYFNMKRR